MKAEPIKGERTQWISKARFSLRLKLCENYFYLSALRVASASHKLPSGLPTTCIECKRRRQILRTNQKTYENSLLEEWNFSHSFQMLFPQVISLLFRFSWGGGRVRLHIGNSKRECKKSKQSKRDWHACGLKEKHLNENVHKFIHINVLCHEHYKEYYVSSKL